MTAPEKPEWSCGNPNYVIRIKASILHEKYDRFCEDLFKKSSKTRSTSDLISTIPDPKNNREGIYKCIRKFKCSDVMYAFETDYVWETLLSNRWVAESYHYHKPDRHSPCLDNPRFVELSNFSLPLDIPKLIDLENPMVKTIIDRYKLQDKNPESPHPDSTANPMFQPKEDE